MYSSQDPKFDPRRPLPYRWLFPTVQLLVCFLALWPIGDHLMRDAEGLFANFEAEYQYHAAQPVPPAANHGETASDAVGLSSPATEVDFEQMRLRFPTALNLPALLVQLPYIVVNPEQKVWRPQGISVDEWNQMFLPFAGLIFWWSAGRGFEAFLALRHKLVYPRITWLETISALVMLIGGTTCEIAISASPIAERQQLMIGAIGFALWSALSIPLIVAKIQQIRLDRLADPFEY
jgi:hypothetical protein